MVDGTLASRDIITVALDGQDGCGMVFNVREGKIINRQHFYLEGADHVSVEETIESFIKQYYLRVEGIPREIYIQREISELLYIQRWLSRKAGRNVRIKVPKIGSKSKLMVMCGKNVQLLLDEFKVQKSQFIVKVAPSVEALQRDLHLTKLPRHIEAFDISNISGKDAVASMVVFENGSPKKSEYRKFKIRTVHSVDDYRMMAEVVERRYARLIKEKKDLPDLILIDGGKGQLSAAVHVFEKLSLNDQPVIGLAKRLEEVFVPGISDAQSVSKTSPGLFLLQRVRDEAHRFAVQYHRNLRKKRTVKSALDDIPGIGEVRRTALFKAFGSIESIREASEQDISRVPGMNRKVAEQVIETLRSVKMRKEE